MKSVMLDNVSRQSVPKVPARIIFLTFAKEKRK